MDHFNASSYYLSLFRTDPEPKTLADQEYHRSGPSIVSVRGVFSSVLVETHWSKQRPHPSAESVEADSQQKCPRRSLKTAPYPLTPSQAAARSVHGLQDCATIQGILRVAASGSSSSH